MNCAEKYKQYFTKEYLMGPNSFRLLEELLRRSPADVSFDRTLDLGCGMALTSIFIANETCAKTVYAFDLWISATDNYQRICQHQLEDKVIPVHGNAMDMPFAQTYFDAIVSVDAYHYFGCKDGIFSQKILPFLKKDGYALILVPGLKEEPQGEMRELFCTWAEGEDAELFKTVDWWKGLLEKECGDSCQITVSESECFTEPWQDWFASGHKYGVRDKEFLEKGLDQILNFVLIYVKKKS